MEARILDARLKGQVEDFVVFLPFGSMQGIYLFSGKPWVQACQLDV